MMDQVSGRLARFSMPLLAWYELNRRDLPWRRSRNPYHIWVSEVMLQQTRVETVIPYYHRFIDRFPTIEALSEAEEDELLKLWEGLGYYSRARNLQTAVREVREQYGARVPDDPASFGSLKGVGPYTAGAVLSIAYNKPEPAVDGNVLRVLSRFFLIEDDIMKSGTRKRMEQLARELIPDGRAGDFNQALMELGAIVCTPKSPNCTGCPVAEHCEGRQAGKEAVLPVKTKAKPPRPERRAALFIAGTGERAGQFLIRQRPAEGLLARMWELPHLELPAEAVGIEDGRRAVKERGAQALVASARTGEADREAEAAELERVGRLFAAGHGLTVAELLPRLQTEHVFSHIRWDMQVYTGRLVSEELPGPEYRWISSDELDTYPFPNIFVRILRELL
jgi:A/G-specific adenine glycosylase